MREKRYPRAILQYLHKLTVLTSIVGPFSGAIQCRMTDDGQKNVKRRQWNPADMEAAMRTVQEEGK